ncbi:hypothetical protein NPX13_g3085 [Xylaria arbuscula]|uniref:Uncharacterized protein n=1 Tax=Xylaria arbuscula TaxID=114810 RepID=A0A9W8NJ51_9PEZI|nr:hypothetical protein NPX13_g3085 [Xylaria arbuscula]
MKSDNINTIPELKVPANPQNHCGRESGSAAIWKYPGLDQNTFYASAFYVHKIQRTLTSPTLTSYPETDEVTRRFLDRLADCFAWTKRPEETAEHVTATALLKDERAQTTTVLIAKNVLHPPLEESFAEKFFRWLNAPPKPAASNDPTVTEGNVVPDLWSFLVNSNRHRLEYYIKQVRETSTAYNKKRRRQPDMDHVNEVIILCNACDLEAVSVEQLSACAISAPEARRDPFFDSLRNEQDLHRKQGALRDHFPDDVYGKCDQERLLEGVEFLGRLRSSYEFFIKFRDAKMGTYFIHKVISQDYAKWDGVAYKRELATWTNFAPRINQVEDSIQDTVNKHGDRGSVHWFRLISTRRLIMMNRTIAMQIPGRRKHTQSLGSIPAIHFPRGVQSQPRVVRMHLYEYNKKDLIEGAMSRFKFGQKLAVTAIQLRDRFIRGKTARKLEEFEKCQWLADGFWVVSPAIPWIIMFRISKDFEKNCCFEDFLDKNTEARFARIPGYPSYLLQSKIDYLRGEVFLLPGGLSHGLLDITFDLEKVLQPVNWADLHLSERENCVKQVTLRWKNIVQYENRMAALSYNIAKMLGD